MLPFRSILRGPSGARLLTSGLRPVMGTSVRAQSTDNRPKRGKKAVADLSQVPIKNIGVVADFYMPPKIFKGPIRLWPKLLIKRLGMFVINTYGIVKYKREIGMKLKFNDWKEAAMEKFVHTNKIFAASCNKPSSQRAAYLSSQLEEVAGVPVIKSLTQRALTFPAGNHISWDLVSVESNPKIVSFVALPDANDVAAYIQFVLKVSTKQKLTMSTGRNSNVTERTVTENLAYTLNPFTDELVLVGKLFDSDYKRGLQPEINFNNAQIMTAYQNTCADIYRAPPAVEN